MKSMRTSSSMLVRAPNSATAVVTSYFSWMMGILRTVVMSRHINCRMLNNLKYIRV